MEECNCKKEFIEEWNRKNKSGKVTLNEDKIVLKCQLAIHGQNGYGEPVTTIWDCKKKQYVKYTGAEYAKLRMRGLLP